MAPEPTGERDPTDPDLVRRTDPSLDLESAPPSSVRPSAPTLQSESSLPPASRPILVRGPSNPPPASVVTTTPTGRDPSASSIEAAAPVRSARSGAPSRGLIGSTLGRYEVLEELGHGGMATVYRALDPRLDRSVALKVIHHHLRDNTEIAQRFRHEARAVAKLKHRSIVEIYDVPDEEEGERFLVAEYVDGPSLRKWLQTAARERGDAHHGPLMPPEIAAAIVLQVLSALSRAHEEGIVHRDVKPENILLAGLTVTRAPSSRPSDPNRSIPLAKLTDFGIAKILDTQSMTSTGQILGSPAHMAPEQIEGGDVNARVDVFATGVLFYELLTGQLPFDGKNPAQVIRRVLDGRFTPPDRVVATVGGRWAAIVTEMLAREPEKRPASAEAVAVKVRAELDALGVTDPDRELADFLREPTVGDWGQRLKPKLLDRAIAAREAGDVMGAAHDLNRALAYDPADPKLVKSVATIRTRERQRRAFRRGAPILLVGTLLAVSTFVAVRRMTATRSPADAETQLAPAASADAGASASSSTTTAASPSPSPSPPVSTALVGVTDAAPLVTATTTSPTTPASTLHATRVVRFNSYPPGRISIDHGEFAADPLKLGAQSLSVGDHTVTIEGNLNCCEPYEAKFKVEAGEGELFIPVRLAFKPAEVFVANVPEGATAMVTVTPTSPGALAAKGPAPLTVPMTDTKATVTILVEVPGLPPHSAAAELHPNDPHYESL